MRPNLLVTLSAALAWTSCQCVQLPPGIRYRCATSADCPPGVACDVGTSTCLTPDGGGVDGGGSDGGSAEDGGDAGCVPLPPDCDAGWCGTLSNACGQTLVCGDPCVLPLTCGGGGPANVCGLRELCNDAGFCWQSPWPQGNTLRAVFTLSQTEAWAVGDVGTALHWDGYDWARVETGTTAQLNGVWESSPSDVWAVGQRGTLLHYDGAGWSPGTSPASADLNAISGAQSSGQLWAVGNSGTTLAYEGGGAWKSVIFQTTNDVLGVWTDPASGEPWAIDSHEVYEFQGSSWAKDPRWQPDGSTLAAVWGASPADLWLAGLGGATWHGTTTFAPQPPVAGLNTLFLTSGSSGGGHTWMVGYDDLCVFGLGGESYEGLPDAGWLRGAHGCGQAAPGTAALLAVSLADTGDGWAVGRNGALVQVFADGGQAFPATGLAPAVQGIWGNGGQVWAVGGYDALGNASSDEWLLQGQQWPLQNTGNAELTSVWGYGSQEWATGTGGHLAFYDDAGWTDVNLPQPTLRDVWGYGPFPTTPLLAVGDDGVILQFGGGAPNNWVTLADGGNTYYAVWGSVGAVLAAGEGQLGVFNLPLGPYTVMATPHTYYGAGGTGSGVWLVGAGGAVAFWDGGTLAQHTLTGPDGTIYGGDLRAVWTIAPDDIWIAGNDGGLFHGNGTSFAWVNSGTDQTLLKIWATADGGDLWLTGENGTILHRGPPGDGG